MADRPAVTRTRHTLPFGRLAPLDFERMCLWLVRREGYPHAEHTGAAGRDQGRDLTAFDNHGKVVFQCKRMRNFGPANAEKAIQAICDASIRGKEISRIISEAPTTKIVILVACNVSPETRERASRAANKTPCEIWAGSELDEMIKRHPDIIGEFFMDAEQNQLSKSKSESIPVSAPSQTNSEHQVSPYRCMASRPKEFIQRSELKKALGLLLPPEPAPPVSTLALTTALSGAGGFGKTTLAQMVCFDENVRSIFTDGILWVTMGDELGPPGRLARMRDLCRWWLKDEPPAFETVAAAREYLREALVGKRILLVVDDVWARADVECFRGLASDRSAILLTTRNKTLIPREFLQVEVDAMKAAEAMQLLSSSLGPMPEEPLRELASRLGEWPVLLKLANRHMIDLVKKGRLSSQLALLEVDEALKKAGLTAFDTNDAEARERAVSRTMDVSLCRLLDTERTLLSQLAVFPEDSDVPLSVVSKLWSTDSFRTKEVTGRLYDLSLLYDLDRQRDTIRLHDVMRRYLIGQVGEETASLHEKILTSCRPASGAWSDLNASNQYMWRHLIYHQLKAGKTERARDLLSDFRFLRAKIVNHNINGLLADFQMMESDPDFSLLREAARFASEAVSKDADQLAGQLLGRLKEAAAPRIRKLRMSIDNWRERPWLKPRAATLTRAGGPLLSRLRAHRYSIKRLIFLDMSRLLSLSENGRFRIWNIDDSDLLYSSDIAAWVTAISALSPNTLLVAYLDGRLVLHNINDGRSSVVRRNRSPSAIFAIELLGPNEAILARTDRRLQILNLQTSRIDREIPVCKKKVSSIGTIGRRGIIAGCEDGAVLVWDTGNLQRQIELNGHVSCVRALAELGSQQFLSASDDGTVRIWDRSNNKTRDVLRSSNASTRALSGLVALDARHVITGGQDGVLEVWNVNNKEVVHMLSGHTSSVDAIAAGPSSRFASGDNTGTIQTWDSQRLSSSDWASTHSDSVTGIAILDSRRAISVSADKTLKLWRLRSPAATPKVAQILCGVTCVSAFDHWGFVSGDSNGNVALWDARGFTRLAQSEGKHVAEVLVAKRCIGEYVISGSRDATFLIWDPARDKVVGPFEGQGPITDIIELDAGSVVTVSTRSIVLLWDLSSRLKDISNSSSDSFENYAAHRFWFRREPEHYFLLREIGISAVAMLADGRLAIGCENGSIFFWDLASDVVGFEDGQVDSLLEAHANAVLAIECIDSSKVATASSDGTIRIWDIFEMKEVLCILARSEEINFLVKLSSRRLISASRSCEICVWDTSSGKCVAIFSIESEPTSLCVSGDVVPMVICGDQQGNVHVLELIEREMPYGFARRFRGLLAQIPELIRCIVCRQIFRQGKGLMSPSEAVNSTWSDFAEYAKSAGLARDLHARCLRIIEQFKRKRDRYPRRDGHGGPRLARASHGRPLDVADRAPRLRINLMYTGCSEKDQGAIWTAKRELLSRDKPAYIARGLQGSGAGSRQVRIRVNLIRFVAGTKRWWSDDPAMLGLLPEDVFGRLCRLESFRESISALATGDDELLAYLKVQIEACSVSRALSDKMAARTLGITREDVASIRKRLRDLASLYWL